MRGGARILVSLCTLSCLCGPADLFGSSCREECEREGQCGRRTWATGDGLVRCFPRDDADCEQSRACREAGRCDYRPERALEECVAAEERSCLDSEACRTEGRCRPTQHGRCRANEVGCVATAACAEDDRCEAWNDRCRVPHHDEALCADACDREGACAEVDGRCLATTDADCRNSHVCGHEGACSLGPAGTCIAGSDADCARSSMCEHNGYCSARDGICVEGLQVCEEVCRDRGWCTVRDAVCVPGDDADCAASLACLVQGSCTRSGGTREVCRPGGAADCAASLEGQAYGRTEPKRICTDPKDPSFWPDQRCFRGQDCVEGRCLLAPDLTCHAPEEYGLPPIPPALRPRPQPRSP